MHDDSEPTREVCVEDLKMKGNSSRSAQFCRCARPSGQDARGRCGESERLGDRYESAFGDVRAVVGRLDPIGLLASGAPDDEYNSQVTDLVGLVLRSDPLGGAGGRGVAALVRGRPLHGGH